MRTHTITAAAAVLLAFTVAAAPALAQSDSRRSRERGGARSSEGGSRVDRSEREGRANRSNAGDRDVAVRRSETRSPSNWNGNEERRGESGGSRGASGLGNRGSSGYDTRGGYSDRRDDDWRVRADSGGRRDSGWRDSGRRDNGWRDSGRSGGRYDYGYGGGRYGSYNRDAWRGRVRLGLGISIFAGSPFRFHFDLGWRPRFNYYYAMRPGYAYGGMAFLLEPDWAEVYIDGQYVGVARDFGGQPVPVAAGFHRIELFAPGYEPVAFDVNILPGQVIPYRGNLYGGYDNGGYNYDRYNYDDRW
jgi:hypothetical protein